MFVQVIQGRVRDRDEVERLVDRWVSELSATVEGWLGSTAGVTDDNEFIALTRFQSPEAARRNRRRHEQSAWCEEISKQFDGELTVRDCVAARTWFGGGSDEAGFVQVIQGRTSDPPGLRALQPKLEAMLHRARPDLIGVVIAEHGDGAFTEVAYFTSEEQARRGERQRRSAEAEALVAEYRRLTSGHRYLDLRRPWLLSPQT